MTEGYNGVCKCVEGQIAQNEREEYFAHNHSVEVSQRDHHSSVAKPEATKSVHKQSKIRPKFSLAWFINANVSPILVVQQRIDSIELVDGTKTGGDDNSGVKERHFEADQSENLYANVVQHM